MLSENKKSILCFEFFNPNDELSIENLKQIKINNLSIDINLEKNTFYETEFYDSSISEYKVYYCSFIFQKVKKDFAISIFFGKRNYFFCIGRQINFNSIEIIFSDFSLLNQYLKDCFIYYHLIKFNVKEEFENITTRKRISFINIDANKLQLPKIKKIQLIN